VQIAGIVALVTGGASGLGLATAERLAGAGARVVILDLPSSQGEEAAERLGSNVAFVAADVTDEDQVARAVETAQELGELRAVINCAGVGKELAPGRSVLRRARIVPSASVAAGDPAGDPDIYPRCRARKKSLLTTIRMLVTI
jgi:NAD(P)-dependent dehydrogenase (short-subunit alcohol dehydrogenase family)